MSYLVAVVDVETTGLFPFRGDRILELAAVLLHSNGLIEREFSSLVNPCRDVGPTRIHSLTAADVVQAPVFSELVPGLIRAFEGTKAIVGHNIRFDWLFLRAECERIGLSLPHCCRLCTMQLASGRSLESCCEYYGVELTGQHEALQDARSTSQLFLHLLAEHPESRHQLNRLSLIAWPETNFPEKLPVTREHTREMPGRSPQRLAKVHGGRGELSGNVESLCGQGLTGPNPSTAKGSREGTQPMVPSGLEIGSLYNTKVAECSISPAQ